MNAWRQFAGPAAPHSSGWQPAPAHERLAQANGAALASRAPIAPDHETTVAPARARGSEGTPGGRALGEGDRSFFERRLGADFSHVRVHTESEAAETADALGALAFAVGSDIAFGPGEYNPRSPAGRAVLAHELTHTVQQAQAREPAVQMQGKKPMAGLGSRAPKDDFITADKAAPEDDFVLFDLNQATLNAADQKKLLSVVAAHKGPVTLTIHGYASEEGDADYNVNLAAWRAAAVKQFLAPKLAPTSKIILFSNGKTTDFGPAEKNRRAGFVITDGVIDAKAAEAKESAQPGAVDKKPGEPWTFDITGGKATKPGLLQRDPSLFDPTIPGLTPGLGPGVAAPFSPTPLPSLKQSAGIDWSAIRPKFSIHGVSPDDRDLNAIEQHWNYSYNFLFGILHDPTLAAKGANLAVPYAVNKWLTLEHPNAMDTAQQRFEQSYGGITTYTVPLSDIVDAALQHFLKTKSFTEF